MTTLNRNTDSSLPYERRPFADYREPFELFEARWAPWQVVALSAFAGAVCWTVIVGFLIACFAVLR